MYFRDPLMVADIGRKSLGSFVPWLFITPWVRWQNPKSIPSSFLPPDVEKISPRHNFSEWPLFLFKHTNNKRNQTSIFHSHVHIRSGGLLCRGLPVGSTSLFPPPSQKNSSNGNNFKQDFHFAYFSLHSYSRATFGLIAAQTRTNTMTFHSSKL